MINVLFFYHYKKNLHIVYGDTTRLKNRTFLLKLKTINFVDDDSATATFYMLRKIVVLGRPGFKS